MENNNDIKQNEVIIFKPSTSISEFKIVLDETNETIWASEQQLVGLFIKSRRTIGAHIQNIYKEGELDVDSTWRKIRQVQKEGSHQINFYNEIERQQTRINIAEENSYKKQFEQIENIIKKLELEYLSFSLKNHSEIKISTNASN